MNDLMIDYFMAVATNKSFTKTSEELYVSQPAISKQIAQLEKELGTKLFNRNNQRTELTETGKLYYNFFSKYKSELINTRIEADRIMQQNKGIIRVGFLEGWDLFNIIPEMTKQFSEKYPESEIVINCCGIKELSTLLLTDSLDVIVTFKNSIEKFNEMICADVNEVNKILIFSSNHPLAGTEHLTPLDFKRETFFAPWEIVDKLIIESIADYLRPYGFAPDIRFVRNHESMVTCVRNNMGVAIMDEWNWAKDAADIRYIPIKAKDTVSIARLRYKGSKQIEYMYEVLKGIISVYN